MVVAVGDMQITGVYYRSFIKLQLHRSHYGGMVSWDHLLISALSKKIWAMWWKRKSRLHINQELNSSYNDRLQKAALTKKCFVTEICLACKKRATFLRARSLIHPCPRYYPFCCSAYLSILSAISQLFTILPSGCFHLSSGRPGSPIVSQPFPQQIRIHLRRKLTCQIETGVHYKSPVTQTTWEVARKRHPLLCLGGGYLDWINSPASDSGWSPTQVLQHPLSVTDPMSRKRWHCSCE